MLFRVPRLLLLLICGLSVFASVTHGQQEPEKLVSLDKDIQLFNGKDLTGWTHMSNDETVKVDDVWTVEDGILKCAGKPHGYFKPSVGIATTNLSSSGGGPVNRVVTAEC